jgi:hypothetical protein
MLIKRTVFEQMIEAGATPYGDDIGLSEVENNNQYDFFNCTIDSNGRYLTEDWSFCRKWRQIGGVIWADTTVALAHVGYYRFQPDMGAIKIGNT